jgi:hypothetical protein
MCELPGQESPLSIVAPSTAHCRVLVLEPPPHDNEHGVKADHSVHCGQLCLPHSSTTSSELWHGLLLLLLSVPARALASHVRVFFLKPPPHVAEQEDHSDHADSTGHCTSPPQDSFSLSASRQGLEAASAGESDLHVLSLDRCPLGPHVTLQAVQAPQALSSAIKNAR